MDEKKYNGWTNYETWCVALWLDNERGSYERWRWLARKLVKRSSRNFPRTFPESVPNATATRLLAERIQEEFTDNTPGVFTGPYGDLLGAALSDVDWHEIAAQYVDEVANEIADELRREKTT